MMNLWIIFFVSCVLAYLIGSIPFGLLISRLQGVDIRELGSGNIGATNISRNLGWKLGSLVGVLDFLKSFIPILVARNFIDQTPWLAVVSLMPVIGHLFPVWLRFKGGKGVATIFGILGAYFGLLPFLAFLAVWLVVVRIVKIMSLVNLVVALLIPLAFWLKFDQPSLTILGVFLCVIIWYTHRANISRLLKGKENRI